MIFDLGGGGGGSGRSERGSGRVLGVASGGKGTRVKGSGACPRMALEFRVGRGV